MRPRGVLLLVALCSGACQGEAPPEPTPAAAPAPEPESEPPAEPPTHLGVPPRAIARARQEAAGLYRMPRVLRRQTLERRRELPAPTYAQLLEDADAHANERASFEGRVGFVRPAGPRLWILPLHTRREGERWVDPIYVLSTIPTLLPAEGGVTARFDGWVVGARTIGQNTLPLIVTYHTEPIDPPSEP